MGLWIYISSLIDGNNIQFKNERFKDRMVIWSQKD